MSKHEPKIYRQGRAAKITLKILLWVFIVLLFFAIAAFFGFRRYIAYTPKGELYLDVPWLYGYMNEPDMTQPEEQETENNNLPVFYPAILENSGDYRRVQMCIRDSSYTVRSVRQAFRNPDAGLHM